MPSLRAIAPSAASSPLHAAGRAWPETNCYVDLWIEVLHALGRDPVPLLGLAAAMEWEVDHFTFLKPAAPDIFAFAGLTMHELALWDDTAAQVEAQVAGGAIAILEVDGFFLPDTAADSYRRRRTKTTIAIAAIDAERRWIEYFHNAGRFQLDGDDYDGVFGQGRSCGGLFPYAELARVAAGMPTEPQCRAMARDRLLELGRTRSGGNPIHRFARALPRLLARVGPDPGRINALCFNTTRQLGGAFELFADHLTWLGESGAAALSLAEQAKAMQFRIARAARRQRPDPKIAQGLAEMAATWDACIDGITINQGAQRADDKMSRRADDKGSRRANAA